MALDRVQQTKAISTALGMALANKDGAATRVTQAELREAHLE